MSLATADMLVLKLTMSLKYMFAGDDGAVFVQRESSGRMMESC